MPISLACSTCAKKYAVDEKLAGKKVKCKACGAEMHIPTPARAPVALDVYGLDEDEQPTARRPDDGLSPASESTTLPGRANAPVSSGKRKKKSTRSSAGSPAGSQNNGIGFIIAGIAVFLLPLVGLQIKLIHLLPPALQALAGVIFLLIGGYRFAYARSGNPLVAIGSAVGVAAVGLVGAIVIGNSVGTGGGGTPMPSEFIGSGSSYAGPPPATEWKPEDGEPIRVTLTDGRVCLDGPMTFARANYRVEGSWDPARDRFRLVLNSPQGRLSTALDLKWREGYVSGMAAQGTTPEGGPVEAYAEVHTRRDGKELDRIASSTITLRWTQSSTDFQPQNQSGPDPAAKP